MTADPRGPMRQIVEVQEIRPTLMPNSFGTVRPVVLSCGHVREMNQIYSYKVGEDCRCLACGQEKQK